MFARNVRRMFTATALAICCVPLATTPAHAEEATSIGSCSDGSFYANYSVTYNELNGQDYIEYLSWDIEGPAGAHNNVEARVKQDNGLGHDKIYYTYISPDSIPVGQSNFDATGSGTVVPVSERMYVEFKFVFDVPGDADKRCTGHTRNV